MNFKLQQFKRQMEKKRKEKERTKEYMQKETDLLEKVSKLHSRKRIDPSSLPF